MSTPVLALFSDADLPPVQAQRRSPKGSKTPVRDERGPLYQALEKKRLKEAQTAFFHNETIDHTHYRSGASSPADLLGYMQAGAPVCVIAPKLSEESCLRLSSYAGQGHRVLIDSGQFGDFTSEPPKQTDYPRVMARYEQIIKNCEAPGNISIVAPDLIADSKGTWALLTAWKEKLLELKALGARIIVPAQKGELGLIPFVEDAQALLGDDIIVGIPCKEAPLTEGDILELLAATQPKAVHFLGLALNKRGLMSKARHILGPQADLTSDSTRLRSAVGDGRPFTELHRELTGVSTDQALYGCGEFGHLDHTETIGYLVDLVAEMPSSQLNRLIKQVRGKNHTPTATERRELREADCDGFWELVNEWAFGYGYELVSRWHEEEARSEISPVKRSEAICQSFHAGLL